ncbi:MAG: bacteriohemerythrin [Bacillota bacterium]
MPTTLSPPARPILAWTDLLLVRHDAIDADHRHLFAVASRLHAGIREGEGKSLVREIFRELMAYAREHFAREEALMAAIRFSEKEEHVFEHRLLTYRLNNLLYQFEGGQSNLAEELEIFLDRWLARHILTSDLQFAQSVRASAASSS